MSVVVLSPDRVSAIMLGAGRLAAHGLATVPAAPDDVHPAHYLAQASAGGRLGWALAVAGVASKAAYMMTYGDTVAMDGAPSWDPDLFDLVGPADVVDASLGDLAVSVHGDLGSVLYNTVSNGGSDFLPAPARAILDGLRDSLPVRSGGQWGPQVDDGAMALALGPAAALARMAS